MKRTGFASKAPPRRPATQCTYSPRPRAQAVAVTGPARATVQVPKDGMLQHAGYMAAVRLLACDLCRTRAGSQFCHADILGAGGKGIGIKSDCRLGYPGCPACHYYIGTSGAMPKEVRHRYEAAAGRRTRAEIRRLRQWPATLPAWPADEESTYPT